MRLALLIASLLIAGPASAEPGLGDYVAEAVKGLIGENLRIAPRPSVQVALETSIEQATGGEASVGVVWGKENTGLFGEMKLHRIALGARFSADDDNTAGAILSYGYTNASILGYSLDAGLDARLSDDRRYGVFGRATLRIFTPFGLYVRGWTYPRAGDGGVSVGVVIDLLGMSPHRDN